MAKKKNLKMYYNPLDANQYFLGGGTGSGGAALTGAASGAAAGAAIVPPFGAIAGGLIGGATSFFNKKKENEAIAEAKKQEELVQRGNMQSQIEQLNANSHTGGNNYAGGGELLEKLSPIGAQLNNIQAPNLDTTIANQLIANGGMNTQNQPVNNNQQKVKNGAFSNANLAGTLGGISQLTNMIAGATDFATGGQMNGFNQSQLQEFNNGGSHEQNPLGGIPVSMDGNGNPNMVEENETMKDSFVFSDRLKLKHPEQFDLSKKYKNKTFAEISRSLNKSLDERPNDSIAKSTFDLMTDRLKNANNESKDAKTNKFANGGDMMQPLPSNLTSNLETPTPELRGIQNGEIEAVQAIPEIISKPRGYKNMLFDFGKNPNLPQKTNKADFSDKMQFYKDVLSSKQSIKKNNELQDWSTKNGYDSRYMDNSKLKAISYKCGGKLLALGGEINEGEYDFGDTDLDMSEIEYLQSMGYSVKPIQTK